MGREVPDFQKEQLRNLKKRSKSNRRGFFKKLLFPLGASLFAWLYLRFEANWIEITRKKILIPGLKNKVSIKLLHLSDLHFSSAVSLEDIDFALREGFSQNPDACVITGDFITEQISESEMKEYSQLLAKYAQAIPIFASLGNHDGGEWAEKNGGFKNTRAIEYLLKKSGIKLLHNQRESIYIKGQALSIAGVGDLWSKTCKPNQCLPGKFSRTSSGPSILLCHNPDAKSLLKDFKWDLMLCGHTHGGQLKIPFLNWTPFAPVNDRSMVEGLHKWNGRQIYITRGVGNLLGLRFNCRPEVSLLELASV